MIDHREPIDEMAKNNGWINEMLRKIVNNEVDEDYVLSNLDLFIEMVEHMGFLINLDCGRNVSHGRPRGIIESIKAIYDAPDFFKKQMKEIEAKYRAITMEPIQEDYSPPVVCVRGQYIDLSHVQAVGEMHVHNGYDFEDTIAFFEVRTHFNSLALNVVTEKIKWHDERGKVRDIEEQLKVAGEEIRQRFIEAWKAWRDTSPVKINVKELA